MKKVIMKELCEYKIITIKELMDIDVKKLPFQRLLQWDGKKYALYVEFVIYAKKKLNMMI